MSHQVFEEIWDISKLEVEFDTKLEQPKRFKVILLNDDYTPMDFVVTVLMQYFHMTREMSIQVMLQVHFQGRGICGVFTRDIAETKVMLVNDFARINEHPLLCAMEAE